MPAGARAERGARAFPVLGRQLRSPLLILLAVTACASFFIGERSDAVVLGVILPPPTAFLTGSSLAGWISTTST